MSAAGHVSTPALLEVLRSIGQAGPASPQQLIPPALPLANASPPPPQPWPPSTEAVKAMLAAATAAASATADAHRPSAADSAPGPGPGAAAQPSPADAPKQPLAADARKEEPFSLGIGSLDQAGGMLQPDELSGQAAAAAAAMESDAPTMSAAEGPPQGSAQPVVHQADAAVSPAVVSDSAAVVPRQPAAQTPLQPQPAAAELTPSCTAGPEVSMEAVAEHEAASAVQVENAHELYVAEQPTADMQSPSRVQNGSVVAASAEEAAPDPAEGVAPELAASSRGIAPADAPVAHAAPAPEQAAETAQLIAPEQALRAVVDAPASSPEPAGHAAETLQPAVTAVMDVDDAAAVPLSDKQ